MLAAFQQRCPALLPMVAWAYGRHSGLLLQQAKAAVRSQSEGRQGDPFGPLLFTLTLQGPLEVVAESNLAQPMAYADDLLSLPPRQLDTPKQKQGTASPHPSPSQDHL
jgi:hypothetical protein